ncbi:dethiobiotin synthetase [Bradyrhizobium sp. GM0.4]
MSSRIVVTGTDTGIGKTVFSAGLAGLLGASYWKPVQAGLEEETDAELVARLGGLPADRIVPERYRLQTPASPHQSAAIDGVRIDPARARCAHYPGPATGDRGRRRTDGAAEWRHALHRYLRAMAAAGRALRPDGARHHQPLPVVAQGAAPAPNRHSRDRIHWREQSRERTRDLRLRAGAPVGRLPWLSPLAADTLQAAFEASFRRDGFNP